MLRPKVSVPKLDDATAGLEDDIAGFVTDAMGDTAIEVKEAFRAQVRAAGLGDRLPNAIRSVVYPNTGKRRALNPTGWVYAQPSKTGRGAAAIIDSYANGRMIVPRAGKRWLLIPSDDCPRHHSGDAFTLEEVTNKFGKLDWIPTGQKFATPSARRSGSFHVVTPRAVIRKTNQKWRRASPKEMLGRTRNPRPVQTVIMFTAVRAVKKPKTVDMSVPETLALRRFPENPTNRWR